MVNYRVRNGIVNKLNAAKYRKDPEQAYGECL